jgi:hypothetical protein
MNKSSTSTMHIDKKQVASSQGGDTTKLDTKRRLYHNANPQKVSIYPHKSGIKRPVLSSAYTMPREVEIQQENTRVQTLLRGSCLDMSSWRSLHSKIELTIRFGVGHLGVGVHLA